MKLVADENGQISLGYIWENLKTRLVVVGNLTILIFKDTYSLWRKRTFQFTGGKVDIKSCCFMESLQTDKKVSLV